MIASKLGVLPKEQESERRGSLDFSFFVNMGLYTQDHFFWNSLVHDPKRTFYNETSQCPKPENSTLAVVVLQNIMSMYKSGTASHAAKQYTYHSPVIQSSAHDCLVFFLFTRAPFSPVARKHAMPLVRCLGISD